jgi:hypothetical protein
MRLPLSSHRAHFFAFVVIAAMIAGCITARQPQPAEQHNHAAVAALGPGFTSQTVHVNGTTIHYVRGGPARQSYCCMASRRTGTSGII